MSVVTNKYQIKERKFSVAILFANDTRTTATIVNKSANALRIKYSQRGDPVSYSSYDYEIAPNGTLNVPDDYYYYITGIWVGTATEGAAEVTETLSNRGASDTDIPEYSTANPLPSASVFGVGFATYNKKPAWSDGVSWTILTESGGGIQGPQGPVGPIGPDGPPGPIGPAGVEGPQGPVGPQGPQGPQGAQGPQGLQGLSGSQGLKGDKGDAGATGAQGPQGLQGPQGPQGPQGLQGQAGSGVSIKGLVASSASLPASGNTVGDMYIADDTGHGHVWLGSSFSDVGAIRGPQGPAGSAGPQGLQGPAGVQGPDGPTGPQGPAGAQGAQGLQGPAGAAGPKGDAGVAGPQGQQGLQGLQGPAGPQGPQGPAGPQGLQGPQGVKGDTGPMPSTLASAVANGLMSAADFSKLQQLDYQPETFSIVWGQLAQPALNVLEGTILDTDAVGFAVEINGDLSKVTEVDYVLNGVTYASSTVSPFRSVLEIDDLKESNLLEARAHFLRGFIYVATASFTKLSNQEQKLIQTTENTTVSLEIPVGSPISSRVLNLFTSDNAFAVFSVTDDQAWLDSNVNGSELTIADNGVSSLALGQYTSTVVVSSPGYTDLIITVTVTVKAISHVIQKASSTAFSDSSGLDGEVVSGPIAIGLSPLTGISSVAWYLDNVLYINRVANPFDFGAESDATSAALWDSSTADNATHEIKAVITKTGASAVNQILQSESFGSGLGWTNFNVTSVTGSIIDGPEPNQKLMLLRAAVNATSAQHTFSRFINKIPGAVSTPVFLRLTVKPDPANPHYTYVLYLAESNTTMNSSTQFARVYFRLDSGNISTYNPGTANGGDGWSVVAHSITANLDGSFWVDFRVTTNAAATLYARLVFTDPANPTSSSYINASTTGAYISWQLAYGNTITPYVATTTSEVVTAGQPPIEVVANFTTQNAPKTLTAEPASLVFSATANGSSPAAQNLSIVASSGTAVVSFSEPTDMSWLSTPTGGNAVLGTPLVKSIAPNVSGLVANSYPGVLRASAAGYAPVDIPIQFNVNPAVATYALFTSPNGVGVNPITELQGATTPIEPFIWLSDKNTPSIPVTLSGSDTFSFWNTATLDSEEATKAPVRTIIAPNPAYPAGSYTQYTGRMVEFEVGSKNYHWRLIKSSVTYRGNTSYTYGSTSRHKDYKGLQLRMDRYEGKGQGQTDGQHFFSAAETAYLANPEVGSIGVMFGWNKIERASGSGTTSGAFTWTQVDHMLATAKSLGKKLVVVISPKRWAGNPPPDLAAQANLWYTGADGGGTGMANWANATMRARYKNILRAFSQRYDSDPDMLGLWTDETSQGTFTAYNTTSGSNEATRAAGWYQLLYELITETPQLFKNTHFFIGAAAFNINQAPGGNFELLANAGVGIGWPDHLYSSATIDRGHKLMYTYKGRVAGMAWGDSYQNAGSEGYPDTDRPRLILRQNLDYTIPTPLGPANYGTPVSEAGCTRAQIIGFMPVATSVRVEPKQARWPQDVSNAVAFIRANPQYFAGIPTASNLVNKA